MNEQLKAGKPGRLMSLDIFRGATIAAMLLVNNAGDWGNTFSPLLHADWHGCTATDWIFPFFLFIMGVAMAFSFGKKDSRDTDLKSLMFPVLRRTFLLFALGCIIMIFAWKGLKKPYYKPMGVLQRISLCYFFTSVIVIYSGVRGRIIWFLALLSAHYLLLTKMPFPGGVTGCLEKFRNISDWLDTQFLGRHIASFNSELGIGHDAEGIMGTLSAISSTLAGVLCGNWLRKKDIGHLKKILAMIAAGIVFTVFGILGNLYIPLNKNLWTPSYVIYTTGLGLLCFSFCYFIVDMLGYKKWAIPFRVYGLNPITAYFGASIMAYTSVWIRWENLEGKTVMLKYFLYDNIFKSWVPGIFGHRISSACWGMSYVVFWCIVMWILYRKKIFIKV
jgi:predicted acyltransferase